MAQAKVAATNADIVNAVRANSSLSYRERIPVATQSNLAKTLQAVREYEPFWNEFQNNLINKIGLVVMDQNLIFENRLKPLKSGAMAYGGMVQELGTRLLDAQEYDANDTNVFEAGVPYIDADYHKINRRNKYKFKVNSDLLEEAFVAEGQLAAYVNSLMVLPQQSAEWDEYQLMKTLLADYQRLSGFQNIQVKDIATADAADKEAIGKDLVQKIRAAYLHMKGFYRCDLNAAGLDNMAAELVLITTPEVMSNLDVNVLAAAFNVDRATLMADRVVVVDHFPAELAGTQALLIDANFYRVYDTKRRNVNIFNPDTLDWIYTYHIWQILSVSRMKNVLRFSTDASTIALDGGSDTVKTAAKIEASPSETTYTGGDAIELSATVTYSDGTTDANAYFIISGCTATGDLVSVLPSTGTYIDRTGVLHVAEDIAFKQLVISAVATDTPSINANFTLTLEGSATE